MTDTDQPRFPNLLAGAVFVVAALSLCWPMLSGQFLAGSDQVIAGFAFRDFASRFFHETGHVPQWNPYIFGGMPVFAVPGHMDMFYPTSWLRYLLSADVALTLSFFIHLVVAGVGMYALLRGLKTSWIVAVTGGVAYELTGIVASQISPGHDGKMFVEALAPFAFLALLRGIRHQRLGGYAAVALVFGLAMLTPHYQAAYYLMIGSGIFALWLVFFDPERPKGRNPLVPLALFGVAGLLGVGIAMIEMLPVMTYIPFTPRAAGGESTGWDYITSYALPIPELMSTILPQFNGMLEFYWGENSIKSHTEYLGAIVLVLAIVGVPELRRRRILLGFAAVAGLFLLVSLGGHTPFYQLWVLMPRMSQFRAAGLAFYLVALPVCVSAAFGLQRLLAGEVRQRTLLIILGILVGIGALGATGALQSATTMFADSGNPRLTSVLEANAAELRAGGMRLLLVALLGGGVLLAVQRRALAGTLAGAAVLVVVLADNWTILHRFAHWLPPAVITYADDNLSTTMKQTPLPFRTLNPAGITGMGGQVYQGSSMMSHGVPDLLGYHGFESRFFDELLGGKNNWTNQFQPALLDLFAVKYAVINQEAPLPGYKKVIGPVTFSLMPNGSHQPDKAAAQGFLYQRDSVPHWVRVIPIGVKVAENQIVPTLIDPRFPLDRFVLFPDSSSAPAGGITQALPPPTTVKASLINWAPGRMNVKLEGQDQRTTFLVVAENWYPDWHATVDGVATPTHRGDFSLLTVPLPPGAKEVSLHFDVKAYHQGRIISLISLVLIGAMLVGDRLRRRTVNV